MEVDLSRDAFSVTYDPSSVTESQIQKTIANLGFEPRIATGEEPARPALAPGTPIPEPIASALDEAREAGKLVFVDFYAEWCAPCLVLEETTHRWSGGFDHVALLAIQARYPCYFHGLHDQSSFSRYGTAILSQQPLEDSFSHTFAPSWPTKPKGFVLTYIHWNPGNRLPAALRVALVSVHLDFSRDSVRQRQIEEMIATLRDIDGPLVVMGDFNAGWAAPGSAVRLLAEALNLQAFEPLSEEFGSYVGDNKRLDWILISKQLQFVGHHVIFEVVSDHFTVVADVAPAGSP